jgi:hypothetical protein
VDQEIFFGGEENVKWIIIIIVWKKFKISCLNYKIKQTQKLSPTTTNRLQFSESEADNFEFLDLNREAITGLVFV